MEYQKYSGKLYALVNGEKELVSYGYHPDTPPEDMISEYEIFNSSPEGKDDPIASAQKLIDKCVSPIHKVNAILELDMAKANLPKGDEFDDIHGPGSSMIIVRYRAARAMAYALGLTPVK